MREEGERKQGFKINVSKIIILNALDQNSIIKAGTVTHRQALLKGLPLLLRSRLQVAYVCFA